MALKPYSGDYDPITPANPAGQLPKLKAYDGDYDPITTQAEPAVPETAPAKSGFLRRAVGDTLVGAAKGVIGLGESVVGLGNLVTGGHAGKALESIGYDPKATHEIIGDLYSPEQKAALKEVEEADGFVDTAAAMLRNPTTILDATVQSAPLMFGGGAVARGLGAVGGLAERGLLRAAAGEGVIGAGSAAESTRQQTEDGLLTGEQAALAAASGAGTALTGLAGAGLAKKLGIGDIDVALAGGNTAEQAGKGVLRRAGEGALAEGVLEEMPQSVQEQVLSNLALDRPAMEGVPEAAAQGVIAGAAMGAPFAAMARPGDTQLPEAEASSDVVQPEVSATPVLGLPAPDGSPGFGVVQVFPDGTATTAPQREGLANVGLTPDVIAARTQHPAATPVLADGSPIPNPAGGVLSRAVNLGVETGAVATTNPAQLAAEMAMQAATQQALDGRAVREQAQVEQAPSAAPPVNMDPSTGEVIQQTPADVTAYLVSAFTPGTLPKVSAIARAYGLKPQEAADARRAAVAQLKGVGDANITTQSASDPTIESLESGLRPAPDLLDGRGDANVSATQESASDASPAQVRAEPQALSYDESADVLETDITPSSGGAFENRGAAEMMARRTKEGAKAVKVDDGWVVRMPGPQFQSGVAQPIDTGDGATDFLGDSRLAETLGAQSDNAGLIQLGADPRISAGEVDSAKTLYESVSADPQGLGNELAGVSDSQEFFRVGDAPLDASGADINPGTEQGSPGYAGTDSVLPSYSSDTQSSRTVGYEKLDGDSKSVVKARVLGGLNDPKVLQSVIELSPVQVMDVFAGEKVTTNSVRNNKSVLLDRLASAFDDPVLTPSVSSFIDAVVARHPDAFAGLAAEMKAGTSEGAGRASDNGTAVDTNAAGHTGDIGTFSQPTANNEANGQPTPDSTTPADRDDLERRAAEQAPKIAALSAEDARKALAAIGETKARDLRDPKETLARQHPDDVDTALASVAAAPVEAAQPDKKESKPAAQAESEPEVAAKIDDLGEKIGGARKDTATSTGRKPKAAAEKDDRPTWAKRYEISQIVKSMDPSQEGRWSISDKRKKDRFGQYERPTRETFATREEAEAALPLIELGRQHRVVKRGDLWAIARDVTDRKRVIVKEGFSTREEALRHMAENATELLGIKTSVGEEALPLPDEVARTGPERRQGNVAGKDFMDTFGFRGVEFGNWNNQAERQEVMNHAYDGLLDMAEVLGIPPRAISLNGDLALAFGARGQGLSGARAHYEPQRGVINLTKMQGAGALAHEWIHALDHYFGRQAGTSSDKRDRADDGGMTFADGSAEGFLSNNRWSRLPDNMRAELRAAYKNIVDTMMVKAEEYVEDTRNAERFLAHTRDELGKQLANFRRLVAEPDKWGRKKGVASAEQLAEVDAIAARLLNGEDLGTRLIPNEKSKSVLTAYRDSNDSLERLNAIMQDVRGRQGFNAERRGVLDTIRYQMKNYEQRIKAMNDASAETVKSKRVPTSYKMEAIKADQGRASNYWATPHEMLARAFSSYVEDKLSDRGITSNFLSYGSEHRFALPIPEFPRPFPGGAEREAINAAFDNFFQTVQAKEEGGRVMLLSRRNAFSADVDAADRYGQKENPGPVRDDELQLPKAGSPGQGLEKENAALKGLQLPNSNPRTGKVLRESNIVNSGDPASFSRAPEREGRTYSPDQVEADVADITARWVDSPPIEVVPTAADLPQDVVGELQRIGSDGSDIRGVYHPNGTIYVVRDNIISRRDLEETLFHEAVGHHGLRLMFGKGTERQLQRLVQAAGGWGGIKAYARRNGISLDAYDFLRSDNRMTDAQQEMVLMDELFAHMAERINDLEPSLRNRIEEFLGAVRAWLRQNGFELLAGGLSDGEMAHLLRRSERAVQGKSGGLQTAVRHALFQRVFHGTPHTVDRFSLQKIGTGEGNQVYGWGMYFASKREVAEHYRGSLGDQNERSAALRPAALDAVRRNDFLGFDTAGEALGAIRQHGDFAERWDIADPADVEHLRAYRNAFGNVYQVEVPEDSDLLDWDKPITEQPEKVRKVLLKVIEEGGGSDRYKAEKFNAAPAESGVEEYIAPGRVIYQHLASKRGAQGASEYLLSHGIPGLRYLDGGSRSNGKGSHNYVIWDEAAISEPEGMLFSMRETGRGERFIERGGQRFVEREGAFYLTDKRGQPADFRRAEAERMAREVGGVAVKDDGLPTWSVRLPDTTVRAEARASGMRFSRRALGESLAGAMNSAADVRLPASYVLGDLLSRSDATGKLSWWHKTVGTMFNLAQRSPEFKRVFDSVQRMIGDVSQYANAAMDMAPDLLPKFDRMRDWKKRPIAGESAKRVSRAVFEGTTLWTRDEDGRPVRTDDIDRAGIVWTADELRQRFGMSPAEVDYYQQTRRAIDKSLNDTAISQMVKLAGDDVFDTRDEALAAPTARAAAMRLRDRLMEKAKEQPRRAGSLNETARQIMDMADKVDNLTERGYAPLSRFGRFTVYVAGDGIDPVFQMFETEREANRAARKLRGEFPRAQVEQGTLSEQQFRQFRGMTTETLELFGDILGLDATGDSAADQAFQSFLKAAKANRSAMKRLIHRQGIAGYSDDVSRVLANFIYSNARMTASNLNAGETAKAIAAIPKEQGQLKDAAIELSSYVDDPQDQGYKLGAFNFFQYIGGSIASAMVNLTQPLTMTFPWLSQYGGAWKAAAALKDAAMLAGKTGSTGDAELDHFLKRADADGITQPQEVHQLQAYAAGKGVLRSGDGTQAGDAAAKAYNAKARVMLLWGMPFSLAEQFNRRMTFIAAFNTARDQGMQDPYGFAVNAVQTTQGIYNKANKPAWARTTLGGMAFTFKQYSINYVEMLERMWRQGGPEGKKGVMLAMAVMYLLAGAGGLPGMDDLDDLIDGVLQRMGYNFDSKLKREQFFADLFGEGAVKFLEGGVSAIPGMPIDVAGRLGMGNLLPSTGLLKKKDNYGRDVAELAGPTGDFITRSLQAVDALVQGEFYQAGKNIAPKAIDNLLKGGEMLATGEYRDTKGRKVVETTTGEAIAKSIGFQPPNVAAVQRGTWTQQEMISLVRQRESEIAGKWAQGIVDAKQSRIDEARDELADWNAKNPETPIRINSAQIKRRVIQLRMDKKERVAKAAPKEIRAAVRAQLAD